MGAFDGVTPTGAAEGREVGASRRSPGKKVAGERVSTSEGGGINAINPVGAD